MYLPSDIIINIVSRLPVGTIIRCKCVCKQWLDLVESVEFGKYHHSKSVPGLAVYEGWTHACKFFELESHMLHYNQVISFAGPKDFGYSIMGSADGLLLLSDSPFWHKYNIICNPVTREYIKVPRPSAFAGESFPRKVATYGFGASRVSCQHKVVRIFRNDELHRTRSHDCRVYSLETGSWTRIDPPDARLDYTTYTRIWALFNGNVHWLVLDVDRRPWVSCFDLETQLFTAFAPPPIIRWIHCSPWGLSVLEDCLCFSDNSSHEEVVIWLMKEYGVETSWTKEFVIRRGLFYAFPASMGDVVTPIKIFKDGDILMVSSGGAIFYYSSKNKATRRINDMFREPPHYASAILHTPSFLSLRSFAKDNNCEIRYLE